MGSSSVRLSSHLDNGRVDLADLRSNLAEFGRCIREDFFFVVALLVSTIAPGVMAPDNKIKVEPINFRQSSVYILLAFFVLIVLISYYLPTFF